jgi:hypothetical protein
MSNRHEHSDPFDAHAGSRFSTRRLLWFTHYAAMAAEEDAWPRDKRSPERTTSPSSPRRKSRTRRRRSKRPRASDLPPRDGACRTAATGSGRLSSGKMIPFVRAVFCSEGTFGLLCLSAFRWVSPGLYIWDFESPSAPYAPNPRPDQGLSSPGPGPASAGPGAVCPLRGQTDNSALFNITLSIVRRP